jgi:hypothetical protein
MGSEYALRYRGQHIGSTQQPRVKFLFLKIVFAFAFDDEDV